jgi:hypothetical protein
VDTRRALAALGAVRARLSGSGYFHGEETRRELLRFIELAEASLTAGGNETTLSTSTDTLREVRIGLLVARAQVDDLLAQVTP